MTALFSCLQKIIALMLAIVNMLGLTNDTVTVELYSNPSSGYVWEYEMDRTGVMTLIETHYDSDPFSLLTNGGGGKRSFTFRAVSSGTVHITFRYVKIIGLEKVTASRYIYTYTVGTDGTISLYSIQ